MGRHCGLNQIPSSKLAIERTLRGQNWEDFDSRYEEITNFGVIVEKFPDIFHKGSNHLDREKRFLGTMIAIVGFMIMGGLIIIGAIKVAQAETRKIIKKANIQIAAVRRFTYSTPTWSGTKTNLPRKKRNSKKGHYVQYQGTE